MSKKIGFITLAITLTMELVLTGRAFATKAELDEIQKLEGEEKRVEVAKPKAEYTSEGLRDPFKTPFEKKPGSAEASDPYSGALGPMDLQGIVWGGRFPQAIINDTVLKVGDTVAGAVIVDINKYGVELFMDGKHYTLSSPVSTIGPE
jgi:hypothetical protein